MSAPPASTTASPDSRTVLDSVAQLREYGFHGFVSVTRLGESRCAEVPVARGVYVAVRDTLMPPRFLERSVGGRLRQMDPTVPIDVLQAGLVPGAVVLYMGRARGRGGRSLVEQR